MTVEQNNKINVETSSKLLTYCNWRSLNILDSYWSVAPLKCRGTPTLIRENYVVGRQVQSPWDINPQVKFREPLLNGFALN